MNEKLLDTIYSHWSDLFHIPKSTFHSAGTVIVEGGHRASPVCILKLENRKIICIHKHLYEKMSQAAKDKSKDFDEDFVTKFLEEINFRYNPADIVLYLPSMEAPLAYDNKSNLIIRKLLQNQDEEAFKSMEAECSEEDLDAGYVELDQEIVYGAFLGDKLISYAGAYEDSGIVYDIGVVTHPEYRRLGAGKGVVTSLCNELISLGKIPQYRVQPQLIGSIQIAKSIGFVEVLQWLYEYQD